MMVILGICYADSILSATTGTKDVSLSFRKIAQQVLLVQDGSLT